MCDFELVLVHINYFWSSGATANGWPAVVSASSSSSSCYTPVYQIKVCVSLPSSFISHLRHAEQQQQHAILSSSPTGNPPGQWWTRSPPAACFVDLQQEHHERSAGPQLSEDHSGAGWLQRRQIQARQAADRLLLQRPHSRQQHSPGHSSQVFRLLQP